MNAAAIKLLGLLPAPERAVPLLEAAKTAVPGAHLDSILASVATRNELAAPTPSKRNRVAGLTVGKVAEQEFERRYRTVMKGQEFDFEDQSTAGTETDFLILNGRRRRAFRINIKAHGTFFEQAEKFVGLQPDDTFALATYKIKDANRRSKDEALPFLIAIVSSERLATGPIANSFPGEVALILDRLTLFKSIKGLRALENAVVEHMVDPSGYGSGPLITGLRAAVRDASWRVISAVKAEHLMNELMWERVPAMAKRNFSGNRESQPNMHFSLSEDMIDLDELLTVLRDHGIQHVATKIAYHEI
jgi:hypothetical protein